MKRTPKQLIRDWWFPSPQTRVRPVTVPEVKEMRESWRHHLRNVPGGGEDVLRKCLGMGKSELIGLVQEVSDERQAQLESRQDYHIHMSAVQKDIEPRSTRRTVEAEEDPFDCIPFDAIFADDQGAA